MPKITVNDIEMYYEIHGKGEPLVMVSGFGADHLGWTPILGALSKSYQVILCNNRGVGQTDVPKGPYQMNQMADDIAALCHLLNIKNARFIGNSMGGQLVQTIAHQYPDLVKAIVISNSAASIDSAFHVYLSAHLEFMKANMPPESLMKAMCSWCFSSHYLSKPGKLDELILWGKSNPFPFSITGYEGQLAAVREFNSRAWLHEMKVPTLVVTGDEDIVLLPALSKELADNILDAEFFCFDQCGHLPHIEYPQHYVEKILDFFK